MELQKKEKKRKSNFDNSIPKHFNIYLKNERKKYGKDKEGKNRKTKLKNIKERDR